jgi:SSS family solute:Na+ symporter
VKGEKESFLAFGSIFNGMMIAQMNYRGTNKPILQDVFRATYPVKWPKGKLLAVVLFAAVLSSFNRLWNNSLTLFGVDSYRQYFNKGASELKMIKKGKVFGPLLALISMSIAPLITDAPDRFFSYSLESLGSLSVHILAAVSYQIAFKKAPAISTKILLTLDVLMRLIWLFVLSPYFIDIASTEATENGITDAKKSGNIKANAYPPLLHIMGILSVINESFMLLMVNFTQTRLHTKLKLQKISILQLGNSRRCLVLP